MSNTITPKFLTTGHMTTCIVACALLWVFANTKAYGIELQRADGSVAAPAVNQGDQYVLANGRVVTLYRKQGVFAIPHQPGGLNTHTKRAINSQIHHSADLLRRVSRHNLPGADVVRLSGPTSAPAVSGNIATIATKSAVAEHTVSQLRTSFPTSMPVFTNRNGLGDLLLLQQVTISIKEGVDVAALLARLKQEFGLRVIRKLDLSGSVYSVVSQQPLGDPSMQLRLVTAVNRVEGIKWAEPQFFMQAQKSQFTPTDALYSQQWNLHNTGYRGSRCDADCDALDAWRISNGSGSTTGTGMVIAIIDDGVQTNHPDLTIAAGGKDFVDDTNTACGDDGDSGPDNDANPSPVVGCQVLGDSIEPDNHGTAVAGIAAAKANGVGIVGTAFNASILPIRAVSNYEVVDIFGQTDGPLCDRLAEAVEYAAQKAQVLNLSWSLPVTCTALTEAIERTTNGTVTVGDGSLRASGSPVVVASGNNASGWVKVTVPVSAGEHAYEWRYLRTEDLSPQADGVDETVWLDDIIWSDGSLQDFESFSDFSQGEFTTDWVLNQCNAECTSSFGDEPVWGINTNSVVNYARSGSKAASIETFNSDCGNSYLYTLRDGPAGEVSFWVWVSANTQDGFDKFEFLVDGKEELSYGDLAAFGFVDNRVAYPANLSDSSSSTEAGVIAVGASVSSDLSGAAGQGLSAEYRAPYSQFGSTLDVVAPSGDQHLGITTTDRFAASGSDNLGFNTAASTNDIASDRRFTQNFEGTSAAAPVVAGIAASLIAADPMLTAQQVKDLITSTADQIGAEPYDMSGRNDQFGFGRVNMNRALQTALGLTVTEPNPQCATQAFDYSLAVDRLLFKYQPQALAGMCPALGPLPVDDSTCFPILALNNKAAVICL